MLSNTRSRPLSSTASGATTDTTTGSESDQAPLETPNTARAREAAAAANGAETSAEHFRRKALRGRLHGYAIGAVALVAVLIALAATNTAQVKVNWLIGSSRAPSPTCRPCPNERAAPRAGGRADATLRELTGS